ncbi:MULTISPECIES: tryptophan 7-halogenase [unclassified Streptomyces]|uniref:FAD-dependent oxidoreductase n=2 Tax=Streptomyces TaxID=1883 RepID=UPI003331E867
MDTTASREVSDRSRGRMAGRAVVVGAGIAGLVAARVLADHFETVVVLEAAPLPSTPMPRRGVGQARHPHGLLVSGAAELQRLFPGLREELSAAGAPSFDYGLRTSVVLGGRRVPRASAQVTVQAFSRDLLEWTLRRRVLEDFAVTVRDRSRVEGLCWNQRASRVTGVRLEGGRTLDALLVVDASGRFSSLPDWLEKGGQVRPAQWVTDAGLVYATRTLQAPAQDFDALFQPYSAPKQSRGGFAARLEHGHWQVTLYGAGGDHPPVDPEGWRRFAASLGNRDLDRLLAGAVPVPGGRVHVFRRTDNRLTLYARARGWPDGLVAVGDSIGAYNPAYAQGMAMAVLHARVLADHLARARRGRPAKRRRTGHTRIVQRHLTRIARKQWIVTAGDDLVWQYQMKQGSLPLWLRPLAWYKERLLQCAATNADLHRLFVSVFHMLRPLSALAHPMTLIKVLRAR